MDTITQGILGAAAAQALLQHRLGKRTWLIGALGGMAADLDIVIRSSSDPLLGWVYHRHFTHSLAFIPFGGALVGIPLALRDRDPGRRPWILLAAVIGYATHGLLDALTSYGTRLWWPFSDTRVALGTVAIIDLLYTLPLLAGVIIAARRGRRRPARVVLLVSTLYLALGAVQGQRARSAIRDEAAARGHDPELVEVGPRPMFHLMWRGYYVWEDRIHITGVRTGWFGGLRTWPSGSVERVLASDFPPTPRAQRGFATLQHFAGGWVGRSPTDPNVIGDMRYSPSSFGTEPLWGLRLLPGHNPPFEGFRNRTTRDAAARRYLNMVLDRD